MPIPPDRQRIIENIISTKTLNALRWIKGLRRLEEFKPTSNVGISPITKDFANAIVLLEHTTNWGTDSYVSQDFARNLPLFLALPLRDLIVTQEKLKGYPSWLYFGKRKGQYAAVLDIDAISSKFLINEKSQLYRLYLFYHELGHMILHRDDLWERKSGTDPKWDKGGHASNIMELEADLAAKLFADRCGGVCFPPEFLYPES